MSIVIVEGTEGSGKSTLCGRLIEKYGCEVRRTGPPEPDTGVLAQYVRDVLSMSQIERVAADRFHFGCYAYGIEFRGDRAREMGDLDRLEWSVLEDLLMRAGAVVVLCDPGEEEVAKNWERRLGSRRPHPEYEEDLGKIMAVKERMGEAMSASALPKYTYDYTDLISTYSVFQFVQDNLRGWYE